VEFGLRVEDLGTDRARRAGFENMKGVLVTEVDPASFARTLALSEATSSPRSITRLVSSVADYRHVVSGMKPGQDVLFKIGGALAETS